MSLLDRLLENCLGNDLTETALWAEGVFRALEQDRVSEMGVDSAAAVQTNSTEEFI